MEGQFGFLFEMNVEFELTEVDFYALFGFFFHFRALTDFGDG
jgi:hypothetical protein